MRVCIIVINHVSVHLCTTFMNHCGSMKTNKQLNRITCHNAHRKGKYIQFSAIKKKKKKLANNAF